MTADKIKLPSLDGQKPEICTYSGSFAFKPYLEHDLHIPAFVENSVFRKEMDPGIREKIKHLSGKGAMVYGFPGTGKTALVKYLAIKDDALLVEINKDDSPNVTKAKFAEAKTTAARGKKVYVVLDEVDAFGSKESIIGDVAKIGMLLKEIDGAEQSADVNRNLYCFGLTNFLEGVDQRLMRPGRLEELIEIKLPDFDSRTRIISTLLGNLAFKPKIAPYIELIARKTRGYTPADLRGLLKHLSIKVCEDKAKLNEDAVLETIKKFPTSAKKGFEYFKEPTFSGKDLVGREMYMDFLEKIIKKHDSANFLFYGPNGTGKSLMPEVLADVFDMNYIKAHGSELQEGIVGEGTKKIKRLINLAKVASPCIVLIDESEGIISRRGTISHRDDETAYINSVLSRPISGVYFFMTTNTPHLLNETTLTRFPHREFFELPSAKERQEYLNKFNIQLDNSKLDGYSFRDLENLRRINESYGKEILNNFTARYSPENRNRSEDWAKIKYFVGDSLELEKMVHEPGGKK